LFAILHEGYALKPGVPTTPNEFFDVVEESGLVEPDDMVRMARLLTPDQNHAEPRTLAVKFVQEGLLTRFQANQLLLGKPKGFFVGRYRILELVGVGAMGKVYAAEHVLMRRKVAIKILPLHRLSETSAVERFKREARAIGQLNHPNIVQAYDFDHVGSLWYLVLELVDGKSLQEIVYRRGPIEWPKAVNYIRQAAAALQHASELGVVHRDVKPANLLLDKAGVIKVLDMGLAKVFGELFEVEQLPLTRRYDDRILGTADYLAPEQADDCHTVDARADIYSLGLTMYYIVTGKSPCCAGRTADKLSWHRTSGPPRLDELAPAVPAPLADIVAKMTARNPDDRWRTPNELRDALAPFGDRTEDR
jgi:eukaryotic-like serine/threonine-protein kinase